jgi:hypothetical protein
MRSFDSGHAAGVGKHRGARRSWRGYWQGTGTGIAINEHIEADDAG